MKNHEKEGMQVPHQNHIRSFVRRPGRMTKSQKFAINNYWSFIGVEYQKYPIDFKRLFSREAPIILEIGFGMGDSLISMAAANPQINFIGIEVHLPGVGACLHNAKKIGISNLRIISHDAVEVLEHMFLNTSIALLQIFFPDTWHKRRHHKRRIVQTSFVELVRNKLIVGGILHMATDWQDYAEHMLKVMVANKNFNNMSADNNYVPRPIYRPLTKFEQRGQACGNRIWDLMFEKNS